MVTLNKIIFHSQQRQQQQHTHTHINTTAMRMLAEAPKKNCAPGKTLTVEW